MTTSQSVLYRPSTLSAADRAAFETHAETCREEILDHVEALVARLPTPGARAVYDLAFSPSGALPKRERRPKLDTVILIGALADATDLSGADRDALVRLTILTQEYFDIVDDVVDGDVADGRVDDALVVSQLLIPLLLETVAGLGTEAVAYWSRHAKAVMCVPFEEAEATPDQQRYLELLDRQADLYAMCTGLAALAAGADEETRERYERLGATVYKHRQVVLDYEQAAGGQGERWNASQFLDDATLVATLEDWERTVTDLAVALPDPQRRRVRALVALDVADWRETVADRTSEKTGGS